LKEGEKEVANREGGEVKNKGGTSTVPFLGTVKTKRQKLTTTRERKKRF